MWVFAMEHPFLFTIMVILVAGAVSDGIRRF